MSVLRDPAGRLAAVLYLVALHSALVGLGLILVPPDQMHLFGYHQQYTERFFSCQAGAFHFVMVTAYFLAATDVRRFTGLIILSIATKGIAVVFLLLYYFLVDPIWAVLVSGLADLTMGVVIFAAYCSLRTKDLEEARPSLPLVP